MPGPFTTSVATILGGQQQTASQAAAYNQQIQARALEDQLRRAQLMMQLEDAQTQRQVMGTLDPKDQRRMILGETYGDIEKRQQVGGRVQQWKNTIGQALIDPDRSMDEKKKLLQIYGTIDENSDPDDIEKQLKDFAGLGGKQPAQPFRPFTADGKVQAFEGYDAAGNPKIGTLGAAAVKPTANDKINDSLVGEVKGMVAIDPNTGLPWSNVSDTWAQARTKGAVPVSEAGAKVLALNETANDDLDNLLVTGRSILPGGDAGRFAKFVAPYEISAKAATGDPDASAYNAAKIGLITHLRAVANAARVNQQELATVNGALANAHSYPALVAAVNQARDMLAKSRKYLIKAGTMDPTANRAPTPNPPKGIPIYVGGKLVGVSNGDGNMTPVGP